MGCISAYTKWLLWENLVTSCWIGWTALYSLGVKEHSQELTQSRDFSSWTSAKTHKEKQRKNDTPAMAVKQYSVSPRANSSIILLRGNSHLREAQDLQVGWRLCCLWHSFWASTHHEPGPLCSWPAEFCPDQASLADAQQLLLPQSCLPQERKYVTNSKREVTPFQLTHYQSSLCHQHCKSLRHLQAAGSRAEQEQPVNRAMGLGDAQGGCKLQNRYLRHRKQCLL